MRPLTRHMTRAKAQHHAAAQLSNRDTCGESDVGGLKKNKKKRKKKKKKKKKVRKVEGHLQPRRRRRCLAAPDGSAIGPATSRPISGAAASQSSRIAKNNQSDWHSANDPCTRQRNRPGSERRGSHLRCAKNASTGKGGIAGTMQGVAQLGLGEVISQLVTGSGVPKEGSRRKGLTRFEGIMREHGCESMDAAESAGSGVDQN